MLLHWHGPAQGCHEQGGENGGLIMGKEARTGGLGVRQVDDDKQTGRHTGGTWKEPGKICENT
eukprot:910295-Pelagomonas_calceolata.AAC.5